MARYEVGQTEVTRRIASNDFLGREISSYALATLFLTEPYHFVPVPEIHHKIVMSYHDTKSVDLYSNKTFTTDQAKAIEIGDSEIINICNALWTPESNRRISLDVFIRDGDVVILDNELLDPSAIAEKQEPELEFIVGLSVQKDKKSIEDYLILTEDNHVKHVTKDSIGKLLIPFMGDWFDARFPGLIVNDDFEGSQKLSEYGLKLLLSLFSNEVQACIRLAKETLPKEGLFSIAPKELIKHDLSNGLSSKQLRPFIKFLKGQKQDVKLQPPSQNYFADRHVLTEVTANQYIEFETVSWLVFANHYDRFPIGCTVILAPRQVIVDGKGNEIFSEEDIFEFYYKGPESLAENTRNSISVLFKGNSVDVLVSKRIRKFFNDEFKLPVKAFTTIKHEKSE